jgi:hypothetical protein
VIASMSHTLAIDGAPALFAAANAATQARAYAAAQDKLVAQRWHLEQLLPAPTG